MDKKIHDQVQKCKTNIHDWGHLINDDLEAYQFFDFNYVYNIQVFVIFI